MLILAIDLAPCIGDPTRGIAVSSQGPGPGSWIGLWKDRGDGKAQLSEKITEDVGMGVQDEMACIGLNPDTGAGYIPGEFEGAGVWYQSVGLAADDRDGNLNIREPGTGVEAGNQGGFAQYHGWR